MSCLEYFESKAAPQGGPKAAPKGESKAAPQGESNAAPQGESNAAPQGESKGGYEFGTGMGYQPMSPKSPHSDDSEIDKSKAAPQGGSTAAPQASPNDFHDGCMQYFKRGREASRAQVIERHRTKKKQKVTDSDSEDATKKKVTDSDSEDESYESFEACCRRKAHKKVLPVNKVVYVPAFRPPKCAVSFCEKFAQKQPGCNDYAVCCSDAHQQRFEEDHAERKKQQTAQETAALKGQVAALEGQLAALKGRLADLEGALQPRQCMGCKRAKVLCSRDNAWDAREH